MFSNELNQVKLTWNIPSVGFSTDSDFIGRFSFADDGSVLLELNLYTMFGAS